MSRKQKTYFNWSSGKDASLALYYMQKDENFQVDQLLTSVNAYHNRVSMHGLRRELLEKQVEAIELPLTTIELPEEPTMEVYGNKMSHAVKNLQSLGYSHCGFGDIFLEDLRTYREEQLKSLNITCSFPLWNRETKELIKEFLRLGFKAIIICINAKLLDESFVGREIDQSFIDDLPSNVDPCGENGEFHTFCYDGPIFNQPIKFTIGEKIYKEYKSPNQADKDHHQDAVGFWFCDLLPI
jgi:uncharacterized protein (TIGR00290 family)